MPEVTSYADGVKITAKSKDGWLHVIIEADESITGYCVTVNGKDLPYMPQWDVT